MAEVNTDAIRATWRHNTMHGMEIHALCREIDRLRDHLAAERASLDRLRAAIRKHREQFPDEPLQGEIELWRVIDAKKEDTNAS